MSNIIYSINLCCSSGSGVQRNVHFLLNRTSSVCRPIAVTNILYKGYRCNAQGPPGTGKTSTIIAIISALLGRHYTPPKPSDPKAKSLLPGPPVASPAPDPADTAADVPTSSSLGGSAQGEGAAKGRAGPDRAPAPGPKFRILVCAQSNAAIDEVIARLASPGLLMGESCSLTMCP